MRSYRQFCPVAKAAEIFCERWTALILRDLSNGPRRFSELARGIPLMSPTLLSQRLKTLIAEGVVEKRKTGGRHHLYALTEAGSEFVPLVGALAVWGQRWTRRELKEHELDVGLLVWSIESGADPTAFGVRRCLIRLELTDQPEAKRLWWFLNEEERCELCVEDPGGEVDLYVATTLADAVRLVRGDISPLTATSTGRVEVLGAEWARKAWVAWLNLGPVTRIASAVPMT